MHWDVAVQVTCRYRIIHERYIMKYCFACRGRARLQCAREREPFAIVVALWNIALLLQLPYQIAADGRGTKTQRGPT